MPTKKEISNKLYNKIKVDLYQDGDYGFEFKLDLSTDEKLLFECQKWINDLFDGVFPLTPDSYKANVGRYLGLYPIQITNNIVTFSVDFCEPESWKDWFIQEGE